MISIEVERGQAARTLGWPGRVRSTGRVAKRQEATPSGCKWPAAARFANCANVRVPFAIARGWRSFLSLRDPAALRDGGATRHGY